MRRLLLIAFAYIAILLSACRSVPDYRSSTERGKEAGNNNSLDGKSPVARIDACSHITREEVEEAVGRTVMEPTRGDELVSRREGTLNSSCMFGSDEGYVSLDIKQQDPSSNIAWNASQSYRELKELIVEGFSGQSSVRLEEVNGIGLSAFAQTNKDAGSYETTELRVLVKAAILTIRVSVPSPPPTLEAAETLAGKVVPRLEKYEDDAPVAAPDLQATEPKPKAKSDEDERRQSSKGSQAEQKREKEAERTSAQKSGKAGSARGNKNVSRQRDEPRSKGSQRSTGRTAERSKKETKKTDRPTPKRRKRS